MIVIQFDVGRAGLDDEVVNLCGAVVATILGGCGFSGFARFNLGSLLPLLMLWLNKGTKMAPSLVIRCPGLAVGVSASRVVALPLHLLSRGDPRYLLDLLCRVT